MRRRDFIKVIAGSAASWPLAVRAQQPTMPVVALVNLRSAEDGVRRADAFRKGLDEAGYVEGQNVTVEYDWLDGRFDRLSSVMADLVRRRVAVIATPGGNYAAQAAKAATTTIPIVFGVGDDPVRLGLVANLARPGGNATGYNFSVVEVPTKRLELFHALVPKAVRMAMLVNPENVPVAARTLRDVPEAARAMGLQMHIYTGQILKGAKPADLPVMQSTKFELVINLKTAKTLGLTIPASALSIADEVIE